MGKNRAAYGEARKNPGRDPGKIRNPAGIGDGSDRAFFPPLRPESAVGFYKPFCNRFHSVKIGLPLHTAVADRAAPPPRFIRHAPKNRRDRLAVSISMSKKI